MLKDDLFFSSVIKYGKFTFLFTENFFKKNAFKK